MYSERVSAAQIEAASRALGIQLKPTPVEEARERAKAICDLVDQERGQLRRPLTEEEKLWIRNERACCKWDFRYFCPRYAKIVDLGSNLVFFEPNVGQSIMVDVWGEHEEKRIAVSILNLKARQIGMSTLDELAIAHRVMFHAHVNGLIASADPAKSRKMSEMITRCWQHCPWFLMPKLTEFNVGELMKFGALDSSISIEWLNQTSGLGRGSTLLVAHLSECSDCQNPKDIIEASLKRAMHETWLMLKLLESTANGQGNWWHEKWEFAKKYWPQGRSELRPVFLPWYVATDKYPTEAWLRAHPIPRDWVPAELSVRHAGRARDYVQHNDLLRKYLGENWEMPLSQVWFWESERFEAQQTRQLNKFYQELCADDIEAFQHKHDAIFDAETISVYRENVRRPQGVFGLVGTTNDIPLRLQPEQREIDATKPRLPIKTPSGLRYDLVPLVWQSHTLDDATGKLYIYEWPKPGSTYGAGVDTGYGISQDRSAIEMIKKATIDSHAKQVAEFASDQASASDLTPFVYAIGSLYSTTVETDGVKDLIQPKLVIEMNGNGETTYLAVRKLGWRNFHNWIRTDRKVLDQSKATRHGAFTVAWSKAMVMEYLIKAVRDYFIEIDSPTLITELASLAKDPNKFTIQAATGSHDDRVMALGWVFLSLHYLDPNPVVPMFGRGRLLPPELKPKYEEYTLGFQEKDLPPDADVRSYMFMGAARDEGEFYSGVETV